MSLPLYLVPERSLASARLGAQVLLTGAEARHAVTVRRTGVGERIRLADGSGRVVSGPVRSASPAELAVTIEQITDEPEPQPRFVLVQALAKHDRDDQAIEAATELGVDEVVPWQADRSVVQWRGERGEKARRKWDDVLLAATKQSRRSRRPILGQTVASPALARRLAAAEAAYVLHEGAQTPLVGQRLPQQGEVILVVGPEGGVSPAELAAFVEAGAVPVRLGHTVLRSSSAGPAALAILNSTGRWT